MIEAICQRSLAFFASEKLRGPTDAPYNGRFLIASHHEDWSKIVNEHDRICINAARDHGKTFFWDFAFPIWMAHKYPGDKGYIFSASQDQADRILYDIMTEVETNPKLRHLLPPPQARKRWSTKTLQFANGSMIYARGYGTKVRGGHPRWAVIDDGLNDETAYSERVRQKEIDYFFQAISNMVIPGGKLIVVGTPFHRADLYAKLETNDEYFFQRYPALQDEGEHAGEPLWPARYDMLTLDKKRREIGSVRFAREFLCKPVSDGSTLFPRMLFEAEDVEQPKVRLGMDLEFWKKAGIEFIAVGVDFGLSSSVGADYTVVWIMGTDANGNRWILDIYRERGLSYEDQKNLIKHAGKRYAPDVIFVESNQAQRIFGEELMRETDLPIRLHHTGESKHSQISGLPSLRLQLENRKYRLPVGDDRSRTLIGNWIEEMQGITVHNGKAISVAEHDDLPMANWICERALQFGGFDFSFGEEDGDKEALEDMLRNMDNTVNPEHSDYLPEDEYVLGKEPDGRGHPRIVNARLVDGHPGDVMRDTAAQPGTARPEGTTGGDHFGAPAAGFYTGGR